MPTDRDAYDLTETPERRLVLSYALDHKIQVWGGEPIHNDTQAPLDPPLIKAFRELCRAGLLHGEIFTGKGWRAAVDWGLRQPAHGKGT